MQIERRFKFPVYYKRLTDICIDDQEIIDMDYDIHNGEYRKWIEKYPLAIFDIFVKYVHFGKKLEQNDFKLFKRFGMRYEVFYDYKSIFDCDCNIYMFLAENRRYTELSELLKTEKSKMDYVNEKGFNIIECILIGMRNSVIDNSYDDITNTERTLEVIEKNVKNIKNTKIFKIKKWIVENYCKEYCNISPYIRDLIKHIGVE